MANPPSPVGRDGSFRFKRVGVPLRRFADAYHFFMRAGWGTVAGLIFGAYLAANAFFAALYLVDPGGVHDMPRTFGGAFSFSVQTMAGIGYGAMYPVSTYAHTVVFIESFVGLAGVALATGLLFAKFSRPTARVAFADVMVVHNRDGVPTLMFRMANERNNQIVEAHVTLSALIEEATQEGDRMRRLRTLHLERDTSPLFTLSWLAFHPIDEDSPLYHLKDGVRDERVRAYIVTFSGLDGTFNQTVHARNIYLPHDVQVGARYTDMITDADGGGVQIDHSLLSTWHDCSAAEAEGLQVGPAGEAETDDAASEVEEVELELDEALGDDEE